MLRRRGDAALGLGRAPRRRWPSSSRGPARPPRPRTSCSPRSRSPLPPDGSGQLLRAARVPPADGDRGRRRDRRRHAGRRHGRRTPASPSPRSRPTIRRVPEAEAALVGSDGGAEARRRRPRRPRPRRPTPDLRRPGFGRLPARDGRGARPPRHRRPRVARARGEAVAIPASPALFGAAVVKIPVTLNVNGIAYQRRARARRDAALRRPRRRRADRRQGGLRRLRVRRLHGAARRQAGELVLLPRRSRRTGAR